MTQNIHSIQQDFIMIGGQQLASQAREGKNALKLVTLAKLQTKKQTKNYNFFGKMIRNCVGEMRKCVGEMTHIVGEMKQIVGEMKQNCWGNEAILLGK